MILIPEKIKDFYFIKKGKNTIAIILNENEKLEYCDCVDLLPVGKRNVIARKIIKLIRSNNRIFNLSKKDTNRYFINEIVENNNKYIERSMIIDIKSSDVDIFPSIDGFFYICDEKNYRSGAVPLGLKGGFIHYADETVIVGCKESSSDDNSYKFSVYTNNLNKIDEIVLKSNDKIKIKAKDKIITVYCNGNFIIYYIYKSSMIQINTICFNHSVFNFDFTFENNSITVFVLTDSIEEFGNKKEEKSNKEAANNQLLEQAENDFLKTAKELSQEISEMSLKKSTQKQNNMLLDEVKASLLKTKSFQQPFNESELNYKIKMDFDDLHTRSEPLNNEFLNFIDNSKNKEINDNSLNLFSNDSPILSKKTTFTKLKHSKANSGEVDNTFNIPNASGMDSNIFNRSENKQNNTESFVISHNELKKDIDSSFRNSNIKQ